MDAKRSTEDENAGAECRDSEPSGMFAALARAAATHRGLITKVGAVVFALVVLSGTDLWFEDIFVALGFDLFCFALVLFGTWGRLWCAEQNSAQQAPALVTEGPYSVVRNPAYWFTFVGAVGVGLAAEKLSCVLVVAIFQLGLYPLAILGEEMKKREKFGDVYKNYAARTPRCIPKFGQFHEPETYTIFAKSHRRSLLRSINLVPAFVLVLLVKFLQREWS